MPTQIQTGPGVKISHLEYASSDEYIEITNSGPLDQDLTGWRIWSVQGNQTYRLPNGFILKAGTPVRIHSGPDASESWPTDLKWTGKYIWNNKGDDARLLDAQGNEIDRYAY